MIGTRKVGYRSGCRTAPRGRHVRSGLRTIPIGRGRGNNRLKNFSNPEIRPPVDAAKPRSYDGFFPTPRSLPGRPPMAGPPISSEAFAAAVPRVSKYRDRCIVVKLGGSAMEDPAATDA